MTSALSGAFLLSLLLVACESSPLVVDGGQDRPDAIQDVVDDGPFGGDPGDTAPGAPIECADMICAAGSLCSRTRGGLDGSPDWFRCVSIPEACATTPTCDCLKNAPFICPSEFGCRPEGPRRFACGEGISNPF